MLNYSNVKVLIFLSLDEIQPEEIQPYEIFIFLSTEENQPEEIQPEEIHPGGNSTEEIQPEEIQPEENPPSRDFQSSFSLNKNK